MSSLLKKILFLIKKYEIRHWKIISIILIKKKKQRIFFKSHSRQKQYKNTQIKAFFPLHLMMVLQPEIKL